MNFQFELFSPIQSSVIDINTGEVAAMRQAVRGQITARDPRDAAEQIVSIARPDLYEGLTEFAPDFTISRNRDGSFSVEVDTHGLVDATLELEVV